MSNKKELKIKSIILVISNLIVSSHALFFDWKLFPFPTLSPISIAPLDLFGLRNFTTASSARGNEDVVRSSRQTSNNVNNIAEEVLKPIEDTGIQLSRKCFDELGCVEINETWFHFIHRPVNLLPFDRDVVNTQFILYTKNMSSKPVPVKPNKAELLDADFRPEFQSKFIVHGFLDSGSKSWVVQMAQTLVELLDVNVFAVDWSSGSLPLYTQATANTRLVGLEIAHFVKFLRKEFNVSAKDVHCIGHSLGSHICGYAGEKIPNLGRITGLDPAEPYFQNMPEFVRLDPQDALLVDVIHTDARSIILLGYGMSQACGDLDFYPNDGFHQPGCEVTQVPLNLIQARDQSPLELAQREVIACNHNRAIFYFLESIKGRCKYVGYACPSYRAYLKGECYSCGPDGSSCAIMGLDADKYKKVGNRTNIKFYVSTSKSSPYCLYHYRINIQLAFPLVASEWVTGKLKLSLFGDQSKLLNVDLTPELNMRLDHGKNSSFLVQSALNLGHINKAKLEWQYNYSYYEVMSTCWAFLCNSKLFVKRLEVVDMDSQIKPQFRSSSMIRLCGEEGTTYTGITSGNSAEFDRQC